MTASGVTLGLDGELVVVVVLDVVVVVGELDVVVVVTAGVLKLCLTP